MYNIYANLYIFLLEAEKEVEKKDNFIINFFKKIWEEIVDLGKDFVDFFNSIKHNTYDVLVEKFGEVPITILFSLVAIVAIMIIVTKVIRK